jgi:hypothetical protein
MVTKQDIEALAQYVRSRDGDASPNEKHREFFARMSEWLLSLENQQCFHINDVDVDEAFLNMTQEQDDAWHRYRRQRRALRQNGDK